MCRPCAIVGKVIAAARAKMAKMLVDKKARK